MLLSGCRTVSELRRASGVLTGALRLWVGVRSGGDAVRLPRAHGKVILLGEHAVVYGSPALAVGLPDGLVATSLRPRPDGIRLEVADWNLCADTGATADTAANGATLARALCLAERIVPGRGGCAITARSRLPLGSGLGSSAALAVVVVTGLAQVRRLTLSQLEIRELAHELEEKGYEGLRQELGVEAATDEAEEQPAAT